MEVEKFRGYVAAIVAALAVIGGAVGAVYVWQMANTINPPPETTLIFGIFTGLIGTGSTFLFMSDAGSRASHAAERSSAAGAAQALTVPGQVTDTAAALAGVPADGDPDFPAVAEPVEDAAPPA